MKENNDFYQMLKILNYLDIIFGLALGFLVYLINMKYIIPSLLGFIMAIVSFYINSFTIKHIINKSQMKNQGLVILSFNLRILIIGIIGLTLYVYNKFNIIAYIMGYTFRFFSLFSYGLILKKG